MAKLFCVNKDLTVKLDTEYIEKIQKIDPEYFETASKAINMFVDSVPKRSTIKLTILQVLSLDSVEIYRDFDFANTPHIWVLAETLPKLFEKTNEIYLSGYIDPKVLDEDCLKFYNSFK